jgi:long-chain acyl-CoA synthetase
MIVGYGLTESTATVSCDRYNQSSTIGSVGRLLKGVEICFGENDEILLKGKTITKGYYRKAEVTELSIDKDGWFHTGDAGYIKDGELFLTDRIKDLFKTSNGKYISPQLIESKLCVDKYIDQIVVVAEQRKFVSALVIPQYALLMELAREYGVDCQSNEELCSNPRVLKFMMYRIDTLQQEFAHYEQIKKITLLPEPFSMERGELTNTLKVKRNILYRNYRQQIEKMYEEE